MNKQDLMKIISEISVSTPDGARLEISESNGKFIIELQPKAADDDPPTEVDAFGARIWKNSKGQYHRDGDWPAIIYPSGGQIWFKNGLRDREGDKPALIYADGDKYWYKNDQPHRGGNKPAVITKTKYEYWVDGKKIMFLKHKNGVVEAA